MVLVDAACTSMSYLPECLFLEATPSIFPTHAYCMAMKHRNIHPKSRRVRKRLRQDEGEQDEEGQDDD